MVINNGVTVNPYHPDLNINLMDKVDICGANNYYFRNRTIHFVFNGDIDCMPEVKLLNKVFLSL